MSSFRKLEPGNAEVLGARWDGQGVNFAVWSEMATAVELCLFDRPASQTESVRLALRPAGEAHPGVWCGYLPGGGPGLAYGFRVDGPYEPREGLRCNRHKLLLDPYARAVCGDMQWHDSVYGYSRESAEGDLSFDDSDSAPFVPRSLVVDEAFDWGDDRPPGVPWNRTVIYECHVRGLTRLHPGVPAEDRGRYSGLTHGAVLEHLQRLGVTAVELLPVHHALHARRLVEHGLSNYWGYDPIAFFAPTAAYASDDRGASVVEFKRMVRGLHAAGIEVILDVVFNHTAEADRLGPTVCFRGLDNVAYYHLDGHHRRHYLDFTGCGNSLRADHPMVRRMMLDSLRYWVEQMHVDGFRFDLTSTLLRGPTGVDLHHPFLSEIAADPVLSKVKLIAEAWDIAADGYLVGRFPPGWAEWNDQYRDGVRRFWRSDAGQAAALAYRLSGSSDLFRDGGRSPQASVNFVTSHDGFTLHDLVTYNHKHNQANAEGNRDGSDHNHSRNFGHEGETDDPGICRQREQVKRGLLATLAFSLGVPMITAGDEMGRTQRGNNNAYCQDNEISWLDWKLDDVRRGLLTHARRVFDLRHSQATFGREAFFHGEVECDCGIKDVTWYSADGEEMQERHWHDHNVRTLGKLTHFHPGGDAPVETLLLVLHAGGHARRFTLPTMPARGRWRLLVNTRFANTRERTIERPTIRLAAHSLLLLSWEAAG